MTIEDLARELGVTSSELEGHLKGKLDDLSAHISPTLSLDDPVMQALTRDRAALKNEIVLLARREKYLSDYRYLTEERKVEHLVHFTNVENLPSILSNGLMPPSQLAQRGLGFNVNDEKRLDGEDHVNLSITNPNGALFWKFRKNETDQPRSFVVIQIDPRVLIDEELIAQDAVRFYKTNAATKESSCDVRQLFDGKRPRSFNGKSSWPTDNQAEVTIGATIDPKYISLIVFDPQEYYKSPRVVIGRPNSAPYNPNLYDQFQAAQNLIEESGRSSEDLIMLRNYEFNYHNDWLSK